jgi:hypothetical protein
VTLHPSSSNAQQEAESALVRALSSQLNIPLRRKVLELMGGCTVELDGYSENPSILCEAWSHIGKPRGSQPDKVMTDALKLVFCENRLNRKCRKILLFADEVAKKHFDGKSWQAECLREYEIELRVVQLPDDLQRNVESAQRRQRR